MVSEVGLIKIISNVYAARGNKLSSDKKKTLGKVKCSTPEKRKQMETSRGEDIEKPLLM